MMGEIRSRFTVETRRGVTCLIDCASSHKTMTITNDAECVVRFLHRRGLAGPGQRVVYKDTTGVWDELTHDGMGTFTGFAPLRVDTADEAVKMVTRP